MASTRLIQGDAYEGLRFFRNYINNSTFELGIIKGWATYADAAGTTPVDGTGGSPNVTFAIQSGNRVRNNFCGRITKDGVNRQGQGVSLDFTIEQMDTSQPLLIEFDYNGSNGSASYVSGEIGVFIYDVTNATLITPQQVDITGTQTLGKYRSFFVATTSTSYRLILHIKGTYVPDYTLDVDNFFVGNGSLGVGYAGTDWQSYTPNVSGFTLSTSVCFWRRSGDSMEIQGFVTSTAAPSGSITVGLPSGYTIDTAKYNRPAFNDLASAGVAQLYPGTGSTSYTGSVYASSATTMVFQGPNSPGPWNASNPVAIANPIQLGFTAKFPISQWSSNVTMADRAVEEYAFNTSTSTATDTTSFGYGLAGASLQAFAPAGTGFIEKRVRFTTPIQPTDRLVLEFSQNGGWVPHTASAVYPSVYMRNDAGTTAYGANINVVNSTDVSVYFFSQAYVGGAWGTAANWRVRKVSSGGMAGYPVASSNIVGRTDGLAPSAGYVGQVIQASGTGSTGTLSTHLTEVDVSNSVLTLPVGFWQINYMVQGTVNGACTTNTGFYNGADIVLKINVNGGGYTNLTTFRNVVIEPGDIARSVTAVPHLIGCISYTLVVNVTTGTTLIKATGRANFFGFTSVANGVDTIVTPYAIRIA